MRSVLRGRAYNVICCGHCTVTRVLRLLLWEWVLRMSWPLIFPPLLLYHGMVQLGGPPQMLPPHLAFHSFRIPQPIYFCSLYVTQSVA